MNYLFFDIECADGNRAICEYGYVLTDDKFNVIKKRNILMDPECPFRLTGREGQADLVLTYPYEEYYKYYPFDDSYETIKNLMTQDDLLIFGHAVNNDIGFLFKDCNRYKLPLFDYTAYDIQKMLPVFDKQNKRYTSLETAFVDLVPLQIRSELKDHRACDDAMKTMLVLKAMVLNLEFTPKDLIESCPKSVCHALEYWEQAKIRKKEKQKHKQKTKMNATKRKEGQVMWGDLYREHLPLLDDPNSIGKFLTVSGEMKEHHEELKSLIRIIKDKGYVAYDRINGSDYLIVIDEANKEEMKSGLKYPYAGQILTYQEFLDLNQQQYTKPHLEKDAVFLM